LHVDFVGWLARDQSHIVGLFLVEADLDVDASLDLGLWPLDCNFLSGVPLNAMQRYFFHIRERNELELDLEGIEFADDDDAQGVPYPLRRKWWLRLSSAIQR
jgi:hypothetical protein